MISEVSVCCGLALFPLGHSEAGPMVFGRRSVGHRGGGQGRVGIGQMQKEK